MAFAMEAEWPEPVVPVQALAESGLAAVPSRYIKPPSQRPAPPSNITDDSVAAIPVIDMSAIVALNDDDAAGRRAAIAAIGAACREWGFFQVVNHGVPAALLHGVQEAWRGFFALPTEAKMAYANSPRTYEGYGSRVGVKKDAILDWGDYFFLYLSPESGENKWPAEPANCREMSKRFGSEMLKLCETLVKAISLSLGLDADRLLTAIGGSEVGTTLRVNYYSKCPQPELTLGLSPHADPGALTVLLADENVRGLQVRKDGEWVTVQPVPGALIVNIGDQIQVLSNALLGSVEHRVAVNGESDRISVVYFYNPKGDLPLAPVPELVTPASPPAYSLMTFDEYRVYIRTVGADGKAQVHSLKAHSSL